MNEEKSRGLRVIEIIVTTAISFLVALVIGDLTIRYVYNIFGIKVTNTMAYVVIIITFLLLDSFILWKCVYGRKEE